MHRTIHFLVFNTVMMLGAGALLASPAGAGVHSTGVHYACYNHVAVRECPGGAARDNLEKGQSFMVTDNVGHTYVYGYKVVNGVHGYVLSTSIDKSCKL